MGVQKKPSKQAGPANAKQNSLEKFWPKFPLRSSCLPSLAPFDTIITTSQYRQISNMADADTPVTLRTRKFIRNPLLGRKQMVV